MRILLLGHSGMLGSAVEKYYSIAEVQTLEERWPSEEFKRKVSEFNGDLIINCIGAIPQKTNKFSINSDVPEFLCNYCSPEVKIINPESDCVFEGTIKGAYDKNHPYDATSDYGKSKAFKPPTGKKNFKSIRTSVIGYDKGNKELLSWFLNEVGPVDGYVNHWWNGITTYEWAKLSHRVYEEWNQTGSLVQVGTTPITKYELLETIKSVYGCGTEIWPTSAERRVNRSLISDIAIKPLIDQLNELRDIL